MEKNLRTVPLYELDRVAELNNLTTVYVPPVSNREERLKEWSTFREIIAKLRAPNGCPWDQEQTHETLKKYLIEEAHEFLQAVNDQDDDAMIEELGECCCKCSYMHKLEKMMDTFSLEDVLEIDLRKMIRRHPHVFGDVEVENSEEVVAQLATIKTAEKGKQQNHYLEGARRARNLLS